MKGWLKWAKENKLIEQLPRFPRRAKEEKQAPKALTKIEESRLVRTVERYGNNRDKAMIALLLYAGMRVGEVVRIRTDDIAISDRKGKVIIRAGKGQKRREVPLSVDARNMLSPWLNQPGKTGWIFCGSNEGHLTERAAQQVIKKYVYLAKLDIEKITPHTFATRKLRAGVDTVTVDRNSQLLEIERYKKLLTRDGLTGLYSRYYFDETVKALEKGKMYPISVIMADLDGLKMINDTMGHRYGDHIIKVAAEILKRVFRGNDIAARIGGDEFVVLLPYTPNHIVKNRYHCLYEVIKQQELSMSVGYATTEGNKSISTIINEADKMMYKHKKYNIR